MLRSVKSMMLLGCEVSWRKDARVNQVQCGVLLYILRTFFLHWLDRTGRLDRLYPSSGIAWRRVI